MAFSPLWQQCGLDPRALRAQIRVEAAPKRFQKQRKIDLSNARDLIALLFTSTDLLLQQIEKRLKHIPAVFEGFTLKDAIGLQVSFEKKNVQNIICIKVEVLDLEEKAAEKISQYLDTPSDLLETLSFAPQKKIRKHVAQNPNASFETLIKLANEFVEDVLQNSAWKLFQIETPNWLERLSKKQLQFLKNPGVPIEVFKFTVDQQNGQALVFVAQNPDCPLDLLEKLEKKAGTIKNVSIPILQAIAQHQNTSSDILQRLLCTSYQSIRAFAILHPNCPKHFLKLLRKAGAKKYLTEMKTPLPLSPLSVEEQQLLLKSGTFARELLASHSQSCQNTLEILSKDSDPVVRSNVASNPNTSKILLEILAKDPISLVRRKVAANVKCPKE